MTSHRTLWTYVWLVVALVVYSLPWQWHHTTILTLNAYDLAEWHSVLSASQNSFLAFVVSLCLRLPLLVISVVFAAYTRNTESHLLNLMSWLVILLLVVAQLPPLTALSNIFSDTNNAQQLALGGLTLFLAIGIRWAPMRVAHWLNLLLLAAGIGGSVFALMQTVASFESLGIAVQMGGGGVFLVLIFLGSLAMMWRRLPA